MAFRPHVPGTWHILGPKNHRPPLPFWPCPWVSPFPSPTKNRAFTHRHWDHPVNRRKRFSHSAVARGKNFGPFQPQVLQLQPPIFPTFINVYQRLGVDFNLANRFKTTAALALALGSSFSSSSGTWPSIFGPHDYGKLHLSPETRPRWRAAQSLLTLVPATDPWWGEKGSEYDL